MITKMSRLSACISLALLPCYSYAMPIEAAFNKPVSQQLNPAAQERGQYVVLLTGQSQWLGGNESQIRSQQAQLIQFIETIDGSAKVLAASSKSLNSIHVEMSASTYDSIKNHRLVTSVNRLNDNTKQSTETVTVREQTSAVASVVSTNLAKAPKLSTNPDAGKGTVIAIMSTGIDYTHAALGGTGTSEAYEEAKVNATAEFDGFPTDVVIGGLDYASEFGWGEDPNPLDGDTIFTDPYYGSEFPTGRGTMLASLIHEQVPGAKLLGYKMAGVSDPWGYGPNARYPSVTTMAKAMEDAVEKGADIIVVDQSVYGGHFAAYYDPNDPQTSGAVFDHIMVNSLAAKGVLVVVSAGYFGELPTKYNVGNLGATAESLTVGAVEAVGEGLATTNWTPHGPVRGIQTLKPDMVSYASEESVAVVGGLDTTVDVAEKEFPVARMAAAAAIVKAERGVSGVEVKALLTNTANHAIERGDSGKNASVTQIGTGVENLEAALSTSVAVWETSSYQPHLKFGQQLVSNVSRHVKEVSLRNYSNTAKTYSLAVNMAEGRVSNEAISWTFPASVTVPANTTLSVPVVLEIDADKLPVSLLNKSDDYSIEAWEQFEVNGYLTFTASGEPELNMGWSVYPRPAGKIRREFNTYNDGIWDSPKLLPWAEGTTTVKQAFTNVGNHNAHMMALPVVKSQPTAPAGFENTKNVMKHTASAVLSDSQCASGKKYVFAVQMHAGMDIAVAGHMDKMGDILTRHSLFSESVVDMYNLADSFDPYVEYNLTNADRVADMFITIDENGQPQTVITDFSSDDSWTPLPPKISSLPTYFTPGGDTVVGQACLDDLYHHELNSPESFDQHFAMVFATDRDVFPTAYGPAVMFNPTKFGRKFISSEYDWWTGEYVEKERYSTAMINMNHVDAEGVEGEQWAWELDVEAGQSAMLWAFRDTWCAGGGFGGWSTTSMDAGIMAASPGSCSYSDFLLMDLNSNMTIAAKQERDGATLQHVDAGQAFSVEENAPEGTVIGQLTTSIDGFFGEPNTDWNTVDIVQVGAIPGMPVAVSSDGVITVANSDALDYETLKSMTLKVQTVRGNIVGTVTEVTVDLTNVNDVAPIFTGPFAPFEAKEGEAYEYSLAGYFTDSEGDAISLSVAGLPAGLSYESSTMLISGTPTASGAFVAQVTASDGENDTTAELTGNVEAKPSSGGALGFGLPLLLLALLRRKQQ
ncbi:putative Ig domain-containing protein [Shewanella litorisediminis]|uniref:S8 family serine peptidase n=1 Tax=Shewanella litorisediminis TaxID=1173586 RepID=A0ABX7FYQ0_9GAMM|nr:putative Ig domain-containing protein [Shewanella litorisediminis]MCL2919242.1 putative Ig domain-containing protein [Shewanella litorisediminis]QRH00163.1 S8 family serine peptidase [Shewanella litorisediminis]